LPYDGSAVDGVLRMQVRMVFLRRRIRMPGGAFSPAAAEKLSDIA